MNVFEFECYREYLKYIIHVKMNKRGSHAKLSRAMKCQPSYLTQVLNFRVNLTKDQVYALSVFLRLDTRETLYLLNLL
jgi:N-glycosylase/DNA lyase